MCIYIYIYIYYLLTEMEISLEKVPEDERACKLSRAFVYRKLSIIYIYIYI